MKRSFLSLIICIAVLITSSGGLCESSLPKQWTGCMCMPAVRTDEGFYMIVDDFLYYYDPDTFTPMLLCSKINCLHQHGEFPDSCDAYVSISYSLSAFDGHLYYEDFNSEGQWMFARMNMDGTGHEKWMDFPMSEDKSHVPFGFQGTYYFYTDIYTSASDQLDMETKNMFSVLDISDPSNQPFLIQEWEGMDKTVFPLQVSDEKLFYLFGSMDGEKYLYAYDLKAHQKELLYTAKEAASYFCSGNSIWMLQADTGVTRIDPKTNQAQVLVAQEKTGEQLTEYNCDGRYIYETVQEDSLAACSITVRDMEGKKLCQASVPSASYLYSISDDLLLFGSDEYRFLPTAAVSLDSLLQGNPDIKQITIPNVIKGSYHSYQ